MNIRETLSELFSKTFAELGYDPALGGVTGSNRPDLCQYQCNGAMTAAKQAKKPPMPIAAEVVNRLAYDSRFARLEAVPPGFINITLTDEYIVSLLMQMAGNDRLLLPKMEERTIVVDYGGPNVAKPLHVGHLRAAIIGQALCNIARFLGHKVIGDVHLGDWGLQMGLVMAEIERRQPGLSYFDLDYDGEYPAEAPVTADDLSEIYPAASARAKTDPAFAERAASATVALQDGRRGYYALWQKIRKLSVADLKKSYDMLGVHFDEWLGESDADRYIPSVLNILRDNGVLYESDGAQVVDVALPGDKEPMPPVILVKSNGGDIYSTTDMATLLQRKRDWNPDECWYVTDIRQSLHFKQVFRCAKLAGFLGDTICGHYYNGTMNGKDGKPYKTRDGGVMRLSDLIDTVVTAAREKVDRSDVSMEQEERVEAALKIGVAALKIGDLINHRTKDYVFDLDRFLASDGKTGPYLQYTAVRIQSVLEKAKEAGIPAGDLLPSSCDSERTLTLTLLSIPEALLRAYHDRAPNVVCEALFDIAGAFNRFYFENKILTCPDKSRRASWLGLLDLTGRALRILLDIVGIEVPAHM